MSAATEAKVQFTRRGESEVGHGVRRISHGIVNSYFVSDSDSGNWIVVDAGLPFSASKIFRRARRLFGQRPPSAIVLTHGHFDHVGAVKKLAKVWNVPVYAHPLEIPYLTGRSSYPPPDPTVGGGLMARTSFLFPKRPINLRERVRPLPQDGSVPGLKGWRWMHTPGHSAGHVSLFRDEDRVLIAGDAFVTTKQESAFAVLTQRQRVFGPPKYFTPDWARAAKSVQALAALKPSIAATGHGIPMRGAGLEAQLNDLAERFQKLAVPKRGRYVLRAAQVDETGVISLPPRPEDPVPFIVASIAVLGWLAWKLSRKRSPNARCVER